MNLSNFNIITNITLTANKNFNIWIISSKDDVLENTSAALHVNKEYLKEPDYPYTEHDLIRFLFKLDDSIEVKYDRLSWMMKIPNILLQGYISAVRLFSKFVICLNSGRIMKEQYENNEITEEALQDWKANYPDSLTKDYFPFEESNVKFYKKSISVKIPSDIK